MAAGEWGREAPTGRLAAEGGELDLAGTAIEADRRRRGVGAPGLADQLLEGLDGTLGRGQE